MGRLRPSRGGLFFYTALRFVLVPACLPPRYLDACSRSGKGRGKVRFVRVPETDDTATNGAGPHALHPPEPPGGSGAVGAAAVALLSGAAEFEQAMLRSLHAAGTISDRELARREQEVRARQQRGNAQTK
jgi:hypothetical protein